MSLTADYYKDLLRQRIGGRKIILALGHVANSGSIIELMHELGGQAPLMLAMGMGTGTTDIDALDFEYHLVGPQEPGLNILEGIRAYERALGDLDPEIRVAVEAYDPDREAIVFRTLFCEHSHIAERPVYGARRPEWVALEDKVVIDALWDELGVPRAPAEIVAADLDALSAAAERIDRGAGTVWAGDAREGWHGGSEGTRWIRTPDDGARAAAFFGEHCDRVRVMPFLDGIPCSIHGIVVDNDVVVVRPVELVTLRDRANSKLVYSGCSTTWDPPDADRAAMRETARTVGHALRERVAFRGTFTIDGVMTVDGFLPTELNPRFGAGLATVSRGIPDLPIYWIDQAICQGEPWDFRPRELEELLVTSADAHRVGGCSLWDTAVRTATEVTDLVELPDGTYRRAHENDEPTASLMLGPSSLGTFGRLSLVADRNPIGVSVGPRVVAAAELANRELGGEFPALECAPDVRR